MTTDSARVMTCTCDNPSPLPCVHIYLSVFLLRESAKADPTTPMIYGLSAVEQVDMASINHIDNWMRTDTVGPPARTDAAAGAGGGDDDDDDDDADMVARDDEWMSALEQMLAPRDGEPIASATAASPLKQSSVSDATDHAAVNEYCRRFAAVFEDAAEDVRVSTSRMTAHDVYRVAIECSKAFLTRHGQRREASSRYGAPLPASTASKYTVKGKGGKVRAVDVEGTTMYTEEEWSKFIEDTIAQSSEGGDRGGGAEMGASDGDDDDASDAGDMFPSREVSDDDGGCESDY